MGIIINDTSIENARKAPKPSGHVMVVGPGGIENEVCDTVQCCHCGCHFPYTKGSGRVRGWCLSCNEMHCGAHKCCKCKPYMKKIEEYEKGNLETLR